MAHIVLTQPELLYQVLLHLPQQDLLLNQRVCRAWRDLIASSAVLQELLFFRPSPVSSSTSSLPEARATSSASNDDDTLQPKLEPATIVNELLRRRFPPFFKRSNCFYAKVAQGKRSLGPWSELDWHRVRTRARKRKGDGEGADNNHGITAAAAYARPEASWRRMIPYHPAPVALQVFYGNQHRGGESGVLKCLNFPNSPSSSSSSPHSHDPWLTFGLLYDIVEEAWFRNRITKLHISMDIRDQGTEMDTEEGLQENRWKNMEWSRWEGMFPGKGDEVGGKGTILVKAVELVQCCTGRSGPRERVFRDEYRSEGSEAGTVEWDECLFSHGG